MLKNFKISALSLCLFVLGSGMTACSSSDIYSDADVQESGPEFAEGEDLEADAVQAEADNDGRQNLDEVSEKQQTSLKALPMGPSTESEKPTATSASDKKKKQNL